MNTKRICPSCQKPLPPDVPLGLCPQCLIKAGFNTGTEPGSERPGFVPPTVGQVAKLFPQFEIIGFIGKGGMGAVYKARQAALDRYVALKILPPGVAGAPGFAERFNREARALARLSHPNIVAVHDFGQAGELHYLVMEFVDGPNLRQVEQTGRLAPEQALGIIPQICEALQFAHNEGIVHRDIKPENILLDKKGRVKITDFGIAKILGVPQEKSSLTGAKDVIGTPHYMAPEQIERPALVDHRADIFSLGVVFYEMLTGELPLGKFAAPSQKVRLDVRLDEVVLHTLEKEPDRRYQHVSEVKTDLETIAGTCPPPPSTTESRTVAQQRQGFQSKSATFFFVAVCFLIGGVSFGSVGNGIGALLSAVAMLGFSIAGYRYFCAAAALDTTPSRVASTVPATATEQRRRSPWRRAAVTALAVFAAVFGILAFLTALQPRTYEARAKIIVRDEKLDSVRSDGELDWALREVGWSFRGPLLLDQVATELDLRKRWAERFKTPDLKADETRALLEKQLIIERIPRTASFEISCFSTRPEEAAEIANKAAEIFCASPAGAKASVIQRAEQPRQHTRPNEPLNLAFAAAVGLVLGIVTGVAVLLASALRLRADGPSQMQAVQAPAPLSSSDRTEEGSSAMSRWITAARWTARVFSTLLLVFYGVFILAEGLPPIGSQPGGVQLNFAALGLMLLGFVIGWKREGTAALLIALGWTVWHVSEGRMQWNLFQTPLPVAALYAFCWWATRGRRTGVVALTTVGLAVALGLGRLFVPASVFVRGNIADAQTGKPVPNAELRLLPRSARAVEKGDRPNARSGNDGHFALYVGWYAEDLEAAISAAGYTTLTTNLGPRELGQRSVRRNFQLQPADAGTVPPAAVPPVVIETFPESGAAEVDPALTEIHVTFSKPMQDGSWAWTKWGEEDFPELTGQPKYLADGRTCVLSVRLQPGRVYAIWLNSDYFQDFKDREGRAAVPYLLIFETRK